MEQRFQNKRLVSKTSQKVVFAFGVIVLSISVLTVYHYYNTQQQQLELKKHYYRVYNIRIPKKIYFSNERIPVEIPKVRETIAREIIKNTVWKKHVRLLQKRSAKWFPVLEPILKKYNIPDDFKYVAVVESLLSNSNSSSKGASGFWQFMDETAIDFGLKIENEIDERLDVEKSTKAACKYFRYAYSQLNSWTLVAASYNKGITGLQKQLKKQKTNNYYKLKLNKETGKYLYRIIAVKEILTKPEVFGIKRLSK